MTFREMIDAGGKVIGRVGLQSRPVVEFEGRLFEKAIHFDDGYDHEEMYERVGTDADELRASLAAG